MSPLPANVLYYGSESSFPDPLPLRAGPLTLLYESGSLRNLSMNGHEVLHQVYAAVRDQNWGTVPGVLSDVQIEQGTNSFSIRYRSEHHRHEIHFVWMGTITGTADGTITFTMDGEARSTFRRNRIGFCVLHPMVVAGLPCTIEEVGGKLYEAVFPDTIAPHQPFFNLRAITHEVLPGVRAEVRMEGDTFEMEDQRNWTDASFKTYCTPLGLPFPVTVEQGTRITQTITLRLHGAGQSGRVALLDAPQELTYTISREGGRSMPAIGLGTAHHGQPLNETEYSRLRSLRLSHLRADVRLWHADHAALFRQAVSEATGMGVGLEVALHLGDDAQNELSWFRGLLDDLEPVVSRWMIFHRGEKSTSARWLTLAREALGPWAGVAPIGAGTDAFFTELNRERPPAEVAEFITYSLNPTVHAVDNVSVVETLAAQDVTVQSARAFSNGLPVVVSPVTFRMRWNPNATAPETEPAPGELPSQVDVRQMSLFGAGWTLGSIKSLAESGAEAITYYETTGWRGVMEAQQGSPLPEQFRSIPGGVYPMYFVFADVGEFREGSFLPSKASDRLRVEGLALRRDGRVRLLLANLTPHPQTVSLPGLRGIWRWTSLDETNAEAAMSDPKTFRASPAHPEEASGEGMSVQLMPFGLIRLDGSEDGLA
jgi:D-apionolactonase